MIISWLLVVQFPQCFDPSQEIKIVLFHDESANLLGRRVRGRSGIFSFQFPIRLYEQFRRHLTPDFTLHVHSMTEPPKRNSKKSNVGQGKSLVPNYSSDDTWQHMDVYKTCSVVSRSTG